jgi:hypothetical protein
MIYENPKIGPKNGSKKGSWGNILGKNGCFWPFLNEKNIYDFFDPKIFGAGSNRPQKTTV